MSATAGLYLDTARLGLMVPSAQLAVSDFARFTGEVGLTLYGQDFLFEGSCALPDEFAERFPYLRTWAGITALKATLLSLVHAPAGHGALLASRSISLVRMAAKLMAARCRRVIIPDLCWPPYAEAVRQQLAEAGSDAIRFPARRSILQEGQSAAGLLERLFSTFEREHCDGAFFPTVSHDGIRLPADTIAANLRQRLGSRFVLVDAAQAFGQMPDELGTRSADLVIAGSHKWLGAGLPLGFAIGPQQVIRRCRRHLTDDPLASLTVARAHGTRPPATETVNVWPLFSCQAAASGLLEDAQSLPGAVERQRQIRAPLELALSQSRWKRASVPAEFQSAILLLKEPSGRFRNGEYWRQCFARQGIALTSYGSLVRLSLREPFSRREIESLACAFYRSAPMTEYVVGADVKP
jgi:Aminotransferase class-V